MKLHSIYSNMMFQLGLLLLRGLRYVDFLKDTWREIPCSCKVTSYGLAKPTNGRKDGQTDELELTPSNAKSYYDDPVNIPVYIQQLEADISALASEKREKCLKGQRHFSLERSVFKAGGNERKTRLKAESRESIPDGERRKKRKKKGKKKKGTFH